MISLNKNDSIENGNSYKELNDLPSEIIQKINGYMTSWKDQRSLVQVSKFYAAQELEAFSNNEKCWMKKFAHFLSQSHQQFSVQNYFYFLPLTKFLKEKEGHYSPNAFIHLVQMQSFVFHLQKLVFNFLSELNNDDFRKIEKEFEQNSSFNCDRGFFTKAKLYREKVDEVLQNSNEKLRVISLQAIVSQLCDSSNFVRASEVARLIPDTEIFIELKGQVFVHLIEAFCKKREFALSLSLTGVILSKNYRQIAFDKIARSLLSLWQFERAIEIITKMEKDYQNTFYVTMISEFVLNDEFEKALTFTQMIPIQETKDVSFATICSVLVKRGLKTMAIQEADKISNITYRQTIVKGILAF